MAGLGKIGDFVKRLDGLGAPAGRQEVSQRISVEMLSQIDRGFDSERDPYGTAWKPLKHPRPGKILHKTGWLRSMWLAESSPEKAAAFSFVNYGPFQQYGTRAIVPRMMVPEAIRGLGDPWRLALERVFGSTIIEALRRG